MWTATWRPPPRAAPPRGSHRARGRQGAGRAGARAAAGTPGPRRPRRRRPGSRAAAGASRARGRGPSTASAPSAHSAAPRPRCSAHPARRRRGCQGAGQPDMVLQQHEQADAVTGLQRRRRGPQMERGPRMVASARRRAPTLARGGPRPRHLPVLPCLARTGLDPCGGPDGVVSTAPESTGQTGPATRAPWCGGGVVVLGAGAAPVPLAWTGRTGPCCNNRNEHRQESRLKSSSMGLGEGPTRTHASKRLSSSSFAFYHYDANIKKT